MQEKEIKQKTHLLEFQLFYDFLKLDI